jgi:hexosaminidase
MKYFVIVFFVLTSVFYTSQNSFRFPVIPLPNNYTIKSGHFIISEKTTIYCNSEKVKEQISYLNAFLKNNNQINLVATKDSTHKNSIVVLLDDNQTSESYQLDINPENIIIKGDTTGIFYAFQTIIQLINSQTAKTIKLPCLDIYDKPAFKWRGMHLDVSRHFFSVDFVKRYIDFLAMYKLNTFHWHLTDDQGWRIEIKKYPRLTQIGAFRKGSMVGKYSDSNYDTVNYGGFYTQSEIKEVVAYAQKKHITVVPEIEMPGHSHAAIAAYPWLSCTGKPQEVAKGWGVFEDVFCTKDSTLNFLQHILDEVVNLFPGKYIHIGGDECPKTRWKVCSNCQALIKKQNLKDEHELQSYFIKQIEKYLNSKGKQIIGWDEILEGGLAPNAAVMSWRGMEGGIAAAKEKHFVVMTPGTHCYFDHYQSSPSDEPLAIGGFTPLEKVYDFNPIPQELNTDEQKYILGAQANVWTEYILNEKQVEYMTMPRMAALAEVLWTMRVNKNETNFLIRLQDHFAKLDNLNVNYAKALYNVDYKVSPASQSKNLKLELSANNYLGDIYYTLDGSEPSEKSIKYSTPIELKKDMLVKSALFKNHELKGKVVSRNYQINKATNKLPIFKYPPSKYYNKGGSFVLVNGETAKLPRINDQWLGWSGNDIEVVIDLEKLDEITSVEIGFLKEELNWIYLPKEITLLLSENGLEYKTVDTLFEKNIKNDRDCNFIVNKQQAWFVKIIAKNHGKILSGKPGAGEDAWLFCDEIKIN